VAAARERIRSAQGTLAQARALSYPRLDARASAVRFIEAASFRGRTGSDVSGQGTRTRFLTGRGSDIYSGGVDLTYPVFDGGAAYFSRQAASSSVFASREEARQSLDELELEVAATFLNLLLLRGAIGIEEESLRFAVEQERRARIRAEVGEGQALDHLRFATQASETQLQLNRARANYRTEMTVLSELLATPTSETVELQAPEVGLEVPDGDRIAQAFLQRPELAAARARIDELEHRVAQERASWWPAVDVFASYGFVRLDSVQLSDQDDELQVGGLLSWNLFEGGATRARVQTLESAVLENRHLERQLALQVEREVKDGEISLEVAKENVEVSRRTAELSGEVLERITAQYSAGEAEVLDVTAAEVQRTRAELNFLSSRVQHYLAQARLRRALGLGLREPDGRLPEAKS